MTYFSAPGIRERRVDIDYINRIVCDYFHKSVEDIQNPTRRSDILIPRQISMYFAKYLTIYSASAIGAKLGNKNHATVLNACKTINNLIETDKQFRAQINEIERRIKA